MKKNDVPSGSDVSAGTFKCNSCGKTITAPSVKSLPPCPWCHGSSWQVLSGKGDSKKDPYPSK